jgi:hypothetical protein
MAISAFPFENADTTETQFSALFSEMQESGVCDSINGNGLKVSVAGNATSVDIQPGAALLRGFMVTSDAIVNKAIGGASASTRYDRIVARLNPTSNVITFEVLVGTPGAGVAPAVATSLSATFEISLAVVQVSTGGVLTVTDDRRFVGMRVVPHTNATLPAANAVRKGQLVYNVDTAAYVFSNGTTWVPLKPVLVEQATKWGPGSGYAVVVQTATPAVTANTIWIKPTA